MILGGTNSCQTGGKVEAHARHRAEEASFADEQEEQEEEEVSAASLENNNRDGKNAKVTRYDMAGNIIKV